MNFYMRQHELYCGIDLHAKRMYACVVDRDGVTVLHRNLKTRSGELPRAVAPFRQRDLVIGVESTYNWYWLADCCEDSGLPFVRGHALAMKAIHGSKTKNDKQDSLKIAHLLRGGPPKAAFVKTAERWVVETLGQIYRLDTLRPVTFICVVLWIRMQFGVSDRARRVRTPSVPFPKSSGAGTTLGP